MTMKRTELKYFPTLHLSQDSDGAMAKMHLINAWLNTDKSVVTNQKPKPYWDRIADYYGNGKLDTWVGRGPSHCKQRWHKITSGVHNFVRCYEKASKQETGEQAEDDLIRKSNELYRDNNGKDFLLEHAWRVLRSESKWRDTYLKVNRMADTAEDTVGSLKRMKFNETRDVYLNVTANMDSTKRMKISDTRDPCLNVTATIEDSMDSPEMMKNKVNDNGGCSLSSSSTVPLERSVKEKLKRVERECSDDSEDNLQRVATKDEYKMMIDRDERKLMMQQEYLLAKKYDLLSNLFSQSGSVTSKEMLFKSKLVDDLLKR